MRIRRLLPLFAVTLGLLPGVVAAQVEGTSGGTLRLSARMGMVAPDPYLYEYFANFVGDGPAEWSTGVVGRTLVLGLALERDFAEGALVLRGEMMGAFAGYTSVSHSIVVPRDLFEPPRVETTWLDLRSTLALVSVQALLPIRLEVGSVRPYVLAGVGGKYYDFGAPTTANDVNATLPDNGFTWGGELGAGFTVPFMGTTWDLQARDAVNRYWGKTQHDLLYTVGVLVPVG